MGKRNLQPCKGNAEKGPSAEPMSDAGGIMK
jgi:hypothetical protein